MLYFLNFFWTFNISRKFPIEFLTKVTFMKIKLFLAYLLAFSVLGIVYARKDHSVLHDSYEDSRNYRFQGPSKEKKKKRSLAGSPLKKPSTSQQESSFPEKRSPEKDESPKVEYWNY